MSNTCYLELICRRSNRQEFEDTGICLDEDKQPSNNTRPYIYLFDEEANDEDLYKLENLADMKIPFYGSYENGSTCTGNFFASANGEIEWVLVVDQDILVRIDHDTLEPLKGDIEKVQRYFKILKSAQKLILEQD